MQFFINVETNLSASGSETLIPNSLDILGQAVTNAILKNFGMSNINLGTYFMKGEFGFSNTSVSTPNAAEEMTCKVKRQMNGCTFTSKVFSDS